MEATVTNAVDDFSEFLTKVKRKKTGGRKKGTGNNPKVDVNASRCPKCGSSERTKYVKSRTVKARGFYQGHPYNSVILRNTKCLKCRQARVDRSYEFVSEDR